MDTVYHLSTYLSPPQLSSLLGITPRHDNNLSLWRRTGTKIELVRHWELERLSGENQHARPFPSAVAARAFVATLLAAEGVEWSDIATSWGTPGLDFGDHVLGRTLDWYAGAYVDRGHCDWFAAESPGRIYDSARKAFGLREGTLMALAAACPVGTVSAGATLVEDLRFCGSVPGDILGGAVAAGEVVLRRAVAQVDQSFGAAPPDRDGFSPEEVRIGAVMQLLQAACEAVMIRNVDTFLGSTGVDPATVHLGLAGGYALNCPTNTMLMDRYGFAGLLAPPCANDSGQALGVGLALLHQRIPTLEFQLESAYQGMGVSDLESAVAAFAGVVAYDDRDTIATAFVMDIEHGPVAWVAGNSAIGPRALGHRSLLADPRKVVSKDQLNMGKGRQWWRPVAPIVLESRLSEWFETERCSPYVLETARVRPSRAAQIPAVLHLDGTARIQTVGPSDDRLLHDALAAFFAHTDVPMLCNTSLNGPGQPIVQTVQQALAFCVDRRIPVCYVGGRRLVIDTRAATSATPAYEFPIDKGPDAAANPHGLSGPELYHALTTPSLHDTDLTAEPGCTRVRRAARAAYEHSPGDLAWVNGYLARHAGDTKTSKL